jgi:hypothetical protein
VCKVIDGPVAVEARMAGLENIGLLQSWRSSHGCDSKSGSISIAMFVCSVYLAGPCLMPELIDTSCLVSGVSKYKK